MKRICTICARGGSKGIPDKNVRSFAGKPLITYSVEQARATGLFDVIACSSDSDTILKTAKAAGVDVLVKRPDELATDFAPKIPVIQHAVRYVEREWETMFDICVDLAATSPLRFESDIKGAVELLELREAALVITGSPSRNPPYFSLVEQDPDGRVHLSKPTDPPIIRRQDAPPCYDMNGSIYVWKRDALFLDEKLFRPDTYLFEMPHERSVDLDTPLDWDIAEFIAKRRRQN